MTALRFAWRALWRDLKSGELAILGLALVVAVAAVSAVGFFTDRVARGMERQAGDILAADLVVTSRNAPDTKYFDAAAAMGLRTSARWSLASVIVAGNESVLANLKAVTDGYPLRGEVRVAPQPFAAQQVANSIPPPGTLWLDTQLFAQLAISPGDEVSVGAATFVATQVLEYTPDEGFGFTSLAPAALMNLDDLAATELIQPGSRVAYRQLFAGDAATIEAFAERFRGELAPGEEILDVREARPELGAALDRASRFLGLAAVVAALLAAVAVAMAARQYTARHLDAIAVIKCIGGTQCFVLRAYALQVLLIGVVGSAIGVAIGWAAQAVLVQLMTGLLEIADLPSPRLLAAWVGTGTGLVVLAGFALPPLLPLRKVSPARVLRRDLDPPPPAAWLAYSAALTAVGVMLLLQTRDAALTVWLGIGVIATGVLLTGGAWLLLIMLGRLRTRVGIAWRYGFANISRRRNESVVQIVAFGLGIMVLLVLALVRADLMTGWRDTIPPNAPNQFLINIQSHERAAVAAVFEDAGLDAPALYPMVRARMTHLRGTPVDDVEFANPRARGFVEREANLSWTTLPQADNRVVAGEWWADTDHDEPLVSVEAELADRLGLELGDTLTYDIAGESVELTVSNLRTVSWDSFNPNFFLVLPPGALDGLPASWIGGVYVPRNERGVLLDLVRTLPTVTVIDIEAILEQVRRVVDQASRAVEFVFLFTLAAGIVVMLAAINASRDERLRESALLRTFGAARGVVLRGLGAEFIALGALAGLLAAIAATGIGWVLATRVFDFPYALNPWIWALGLGGGALGIGAVGLLATRSVLKVPPLLVLRRS